MNIQISVCYLIRAGSSHKVTVNWFSTLYSYKAFPRPTCKELYIDIIRLLYVQLQTNTSSLSSLLTDLLCVLLRAGRQSEVSLLLPDGTNWSIPCICLLWCHLAVWMEEGGAYCAEWGRLHSGMKKAIDWIDWVYIILAECDMHSIQVPMPTFYNIAITAENPFSYVVGTEPLVHLFCVYYPSFFKECVS